MKATILKTSLALAALMTAVPAMAQDSGLAVTVNGQPVAFPGQGPIENEGRVLVPLRGVLEKLGAYVSFDSGLQQVKAVRNETQITLPIGSRTAQVGDRSVTLDVPARIVNGSTMVPLRFVAESLGARVDYRPEISTVAIRTGSGGGSGPVPPPRPGNPRRVVRGTILSVDPRAKHLVILQGNGDRRDVDLTPDYHVQRRTSAGDVTIDLDRLHRGDLIALEMQAGDARTVTVLPGGGGR